MDSEQIHYNSWRTARAQSAVRITNACAFSATFIVPREHTAVLALWQHVCVPPVFFPALTRCAYTRGRGEEEAWNTV